MADELPSRPNDPAPRGALAPYSLGPDAWWNPFSPSFPPTAAGRVLGEKLRKGIELEAKVVTDAAEATSEAVDAIKPDPIGPTVAFLGEPTWGYYGPHILVGLVSIGAVAGGVLVYRRSKRRKR